MKNFKDESFILQYLSPKVMRDMRLFCIDDDDGHDYLEVSAIHDESGYRLLRESLSGHYNLGNREPNIQVFDVNVRGDRSLTLAHYMHKGQMLDAESTMEIIKHVHTLWGFDVKLQSMDEFGGIKHSYCTSNSDSSREPDRE
jgi:spore cortex formation protein SpoVR/YcgB (stage V sporulation)